MIRSIRILAWGIGACALGAALFGTDAGRAAATEGLRGVWTAERSNWRIEKAGNATIVQLTLRRVGAHGRWDSSHPVALPDLEGLTSAAIEAPSSDVRFALKRDAGTLSFEGRFQAGAGAGHFTFAPSAAYVADMRGRGYGDIDDEKAMNLAIHDLSRAFIAELASLGYERVDLDKLMALRIHGASGEFIRGLAGLGYKRLDLDQVVAFRIHGVSPEFIKAFRGLGYDKLTSDQLVAMRIHGVSPDFVSQLKALGYTGVRVDDLVSMRIHGVTTDFIRRVQGRPSSRTVTVERLVSMRIHGEEPE